MRRISPVLFVLLGSLVGVAPGCGSGDEGIDNKPNKDEEDGGKGDETSEDTEGNGTSTASSNATSGGATSAASTAPATTGSTDTSSAGTSADPEPLGEIIGIPCEEDSDCTAPTTCIRTHDSFAGALPGSGICSMPCEVSADCSAVDAIAYCDFVGTATQEAIDNAAEGELPEGLGTICVQQCLYGQPDETKCGGLTTFTCFPREDVVRADSTGQVQFMLGGCTPLCHADSDCSDDQVCDLYWGMCVDAAPQGKDLGESCDMNATESECASRYCLGIAADLDVGVCSATCNYHPDTAACGGPADETAKAGCIGDMFTPIPSALGDRGQCIPLCDVEEDCPLGLACNLDEPELTKETYGRSGFCFPTEESVAEALEEQPDPETEDAGVAPTSDATSDETSGDGGD